MFELDDCVGIITCNTGKKIAEKFNEHILAHGLTRVQWIALYYLGKYESMTQRELSAKMHITDSTMVRLIDRLEKEHYVQRIKDITDRRITNLKLTETGVRKRQDILSIGEEFANSVSRGLTNEEIEVFKKITTKMLENIC